MTKARKSGNKKPARFTKRKTISRIPRMYNDTQRPSLITKAHRTVTSAGSLMHVVVNLNGFLPSVRQLADDFEFYRISSVQVYLHCQRQVNTDNFELPIMYAVPQYNNVLPTTQQAFLAYKNLRYYTFNRDRTFNFAPYAQISAGNTSQWVRSPKVSTENKGLNHLGYSFFAFGQVINATVTATIQFYTLSGKQGDAIEFDDMMLRRWAQQGSQMIDQKIADKFQSLSNVSSSRNTLTKAQILKLLQRGGIQKNPGPVSLDAAQESEEQPPPQAPVQPSCSVY